MDRRGPPESRPAGIGTESFPAAFAPLVVVRLGCLRSETQLRWPRQGRRKSMQIIDFDGNGRPSDPDVGTGTIALLVQREWLSVVRIELLPPEDFGPALEHALNDAKLEHRVRAALDNAFPRGLSQERGWVLKCPPDIAADAIFASVN